MAPISVSKILMILYIAGYKSRFIACRMSGSIFGLSSTRAHLRTLSTKAWNIYTFLFQRESGAFLWEINDFPTYAQTCASRLGYVY
jgi:hypothetical protein